MEPIKLGIILGSVREGRKGEGVARWLHALASARAAELAPTLLDLKEWPLPHYTNAAGAKAAEKSYSDPLLQRWVKAIESQDAFVWVTPEYNFGYPGQLKDAIDLVYAGWGTKPVGFVSYGGVSGGIRSVQQLRQLLPELHALSVHDEVNIAWIGRAIDEKGAPRDPYYAAKAEGMLDQLVWWGAALRDARAKTPFPALRQAKPPQ